jgi:Family of unknown function (DUF5684)
LWHDKDQLIRQTIQEDQPSAVGESMAATYTYGSSSSNSWVIIIAAIAGYLIWALPLMGVFLKAGEPGIAAFIPIWNLLVLLKIVGRPWWWLILYIIPIVGIIIAIVVLYDLAKSFGHGVGFTIGLVLLDWIFLLILWLGGSRYLGPRGEPAGAYA